MVYLKIQSIAEEELKRLKNQVGGSGYGEVPFNYDAKPDDNVTANEDSNEKADDDSEEPPDEIYVPHPKFLIPDGMDLVCD